MEPKDVNPYVRAEDIARCINGIVNYVCNIHVTAACSQSTPLDQTMHFVIDCWCDEIKFYQFLLLKALHYEY